jgi:hypothetical protein
LSCNIRQNANIKGFQLPEDKIPSNLVNQNTEIKISQVADDTTICTQDAKSIIEAIHVIENFSKVSGLQLNMSKTEGILLKGGMQSAETLDIK